MLRNGQIVLYALRNNLTVETIHRKAPVALARLLECAAVMP
jgi:hypothetical protein